MTPSPKDYDWKSWIKHLFLRPDDRLLAVLKVEMPELAAYFDETGHPADPQKHFFGFAGFIGTVTTWEALVSVWKSVCPKEFYPFHMLDFVHRTRKDQTRQREVLTALIDAVCASEIVPIWDICHVCEFRDKVRPFTHDEEKQIYLLMLNHLFVQAGVSVLASRESEDSAQRRSSIVFAHRKLAGLATDIWWEQKASGEGPIAGALSGMLLESVSVATPVAVPPLQIADLLAWEVGHHYDRWIKAGKEQPKRKSFERLSNLPEVPNVGIPSSNFVGPHELRGDSIFL